jgi:hypothetical protein
MFGSRKEHERLVTGTFQACSDDYTAASQKIYRVDGARRQSPLAGFAAVSAGAHIFIPYS